MKMLLIALAIFSISFSASAETIRGGIDCKIIDQHYMRIIAGEVLSSKGRQGGDGNGATLHLRYEITRPMVGQSFNFKIEFGRFDILFDETYPEDRLSPLLNAEGSPVGFTAASANGDITASMHPDSITILRRNNRLSLSLNNEDIAGVYQAGDLDGPDMRTHVMGFACIHPANAIQQITERLFND